MGTTNRKKTAISLFSGVGGLDLGLAGANISVLQLCESWPPARRVLEDRFPDTPIDSDVRTFEPADSPAILTAGFPCTNLSHVGDRTGIGGSATGLVEHVFRIAELTLADWISLENVPNILGLHKGEGIRHVVMTLESLGYKWAYRTVDSRFTGVPQRRPRVVILAWRSGTPAVTLLSQDVGEPAVGTGQEAFGFYWTEGRHSFGLVPDAIPTLKGGSTLGLPSAPGIWIPGREPGRKIVLPTIEQGELLQGLEPGWTEAAVRPGEPDMRWKLIGNAVTTGVGKWLGDRILAADESDDASVLENLGPIDRTKKWPPAAWGAEGQAWASPASRWPRRLRYTHLADVIDADTAKPMSHRATAGFLSRLAESSLPIDPNLYSNLEEHLAITRPVMTRSSRGRKLFTSTQGSWASSPPVRRRMQATGPRNTKPEIALRRALTRLGLRYRLQTRPEADLRWRMDVVFRSARVAVDVRGCFWHVCPVHATKPKQNGERWKDKLAGNVARDRRIVATLMERGWCIVVVWEHEEPAAAAERIAALVRTRSETGNRPGCVVQERAS